MMAATPPAPQATPGGWLAVRARLLARLVAMLPADTCSLPEVVRVDRRLVYRQPAGEWVALPLPEAGPPLAYVRALAPPRAQAGTRAWSSRGRRWVWVQPVRLVAVVPGYAVPALAQALQLAAWPETTAQPQTLWLEPEVFWTEELQLKKPLPGVPPATAALDLQLRIELPTPTDPACAPPLCPETYTNPT
jgi:hypothetical protein